MEHERHGWIDWAGTYTWITSEPDAGVIHTPILDINVERSFIDHDRSSGTIVDTHRLSARNHFGNGWSEVNRSRTFRVIFETLFS